MWKTEIRYRGEKPLGGCVREVPVGDVLKASSLWYPICMIAATCGQPHVLIIFRWPTDELGKGCGV